MLHESPSSITPNTIIRLSKKMMPLIAVAFPGAYKFFVIYFLSYFATEDTTNTFSKSYFLVSFLVTFSGVPFSSVVMGKDSNISIYQLIIAVVISSTFIMLLSYYFKLSSYDISHISILFFSLMFMSMYEILKTKLLNTGRFNEVVFASLITVFIFLIVFFLGGSNQVIIATFFLALLIPISVMFYLSNLNNDCHFVKKLTLCKAYLNFTLSNALSTSLIAFLPLFLIEELGDGVAIKMAQVFTFSTLLYLLPRALLAKDLPAIRSGKQPKKKVIILFYHILLFVIGCIAIGSLAINFFGVSNSFTYFLLFTGIITSQLSLPFSALLVVNSDSKTTLAINFISAFHFVFLAGLCFYYLEQGYNRANCILTAFIVFQLIKLFYNYKKTIGFKESYL